MRQEPLFPALSPKGDRGPEARQPLPLNMGKGQGDRAQSLNVVVKLQHFDPRQR